MKTKTTKLPAKREALEHLNGVRENMNDNYINSSTDGEIPLRETIRDPNDPTKLLFLLWDGGKVTTVPHLQKDGRVCKPPETEFAAHADLRLPDRILPCGNSRELFTDLSSTICKFFDLSEDEVLLVSLYIISSWFPDCMKVVPYLWLVGPLGSGKSTLLKFLHCVCRRTLLIGDVRPASLYKLSSVLCPTLLLDELEPDSSSTGVEVRRLLRIGNTPGITAARNGKLFQTFGFKVISSRQPPDDVALASRAIFIRLLQTQKNLLPLDEAAMEVIASEFQPRLLMYRLQNHLSVKKYRLSFQKLAGLTPRTRDLAQAMAAPLLGEAMLEDQLLAILRDYDREARIERSLELEWLIVEALFDLCHKDTEISDKSSHILVGGLSSRINEMLAFRGESIRFSAKKVGSGLKSLGIRTRWLGSLGRGLTFTSPFWTQIHKLARQLGFDRRDIASLDSLDSGYGGPPCVHCEEFGITGGLSFVDLHVRPRREFRRDQRRQLLNQTPAADAEHKATLNANGKMVTDLESSSADVGGRPDTR